jgi:membrane protease YdiL (CAAX protease family)
VHAKKIRALAGAAALVGWSGFVAPRIPPRWQVPMHATLSAALVASTRAPLGLGPPAVWRGLRLGTATATVVFLGVAASTRIPRVRADMAARELPESTVGWLAVRIPLGTVWSEEAAFRAALGTVAAEAFGPRWGPVLQATAFGLSHVPDAKAMGEPVVGTVLVTGVAGLAFAWCYERSGSLLAPILTHLASNEAGAVAAVLVQRAGLRQTSRASARS